MTQLIAVQHRLYRRKLNCAKLALDEFLSNFGLAQDHLIKQKKPQCIHRPRLKKATHGQRLVPYPVHKAITSADRGKAASREIQCIVEVVPTVKRLLNQYAKMEVCLPQQSDFFPATYQKVEVSHPGSVPLLTATLADGYYRCSAQGATRFALPAYGGSNITAGCRTKCENKAEKVGGLADKQSYQYLPYLQFDLEQRDTKKNRRQLGKYLLMKIRSTHRLANEQTQQAAYAVLRSPSTPSFRVVTFFITFLTGERRLGSPAFRKHTAITSIQAIINYFDQIQP